LISVEGKLVLVVAQQLLEPYRVHPAFGQVDVNLLFPDGLRVFEIKRRKLHQTGPRQEGRQMIISQGRQKSSAGQSRGKFVLSESNFRRVLREH
jgi:hypothetical protein